MSNKHLVNGVSGGSTTTGSGKLQTFEILFDSKVPCYKSGEEITGHIRIVLKEPMKMKMVKLQFVGRTRVGWSEQILTVNDLKKAEKPSAELNGKDTIGPKSKYSNEIVHIDKTIDLLERRPGQELPHDFVLPSGENLLPFSFPLPKKSLPTSFESDCAYVRYFCRATICKPWKHDHVTKRAFTVLASPDWKSATKENYPDLHKPLAVSENVASKSCFCIKGRLACEVSLPKQVFNVGEAFVVGCKVVNSSKNAVSDVAFRLVQTVTCKGQSKDKQGERTTVFNRVAFEKLAFEKQIRNGQTSELNDQEITMRVPPCAPTCVDNSVLRIEYQLRADVRVANKTTEALSVRLPITVIGAPYDDNVAKILKDSRIEANYRAEKCCYFYDCCFGKRSIRDDEDNQYTRGELEFAPLYSQLEP